MKVYQDLTIEELEAQYFLRGTRPDYDKVMVPDWVERSAVFMRSARSLADLSYGPLPRNRLDFFPAGSGVKGFVLYIHGGYWQRGDKSVYRFLADPLVREGFSVAVMNYQMCPDVRLSDIAPQARLAVIWLWQHAKELGIPRANFNVMGHSAGGHLTAEMLLTDWPAQSGDLPRELIRAGVALSGIYDLEPLLYCSENSGLRLDAEEAFTASPIHRAPATAAPQLIAFGANEPPDMRRQSADYCTRFSAHSRRMESYIIPCADHFEVVNVLGDPKSELFAKVVSFVSP